MNHCDVTTVGPVAPVDTARLHILAELGDVGFLRDLVGTFVTDARGRVRAIADAADRSDAATVGREAHALKSAAATLGAETLRALALETELAGRAGKVNSDSAASLATVLAATEIWLANWLAAPH